ncbi:MAG: response regulator transcription factor [Oscillospiraceae bacterium]|nr:response regulator transcription factor [Oscillospiraceae bacterium]
MYTILVCDDEPDIVSALCVYLREYRVLPASGGAEALEILSREKADLVLLDLMMPGLDGLAVLRRIREIANIPVILLTAKAEDADKIVGLDAGADDYVTKPFSPTELLARVRAQLRRYTSLGASPRRSGTVTVGGLCLDRDAGVVTLYGEPVALTPTEFGILALLMESPGRIFSSREIYDRVWRGAGWSGLETSVPVHIRHLREKIEIDPAEPRYIKVVWGRGYRLDPGR